jgi:hypothetical protein
MRLINGLVSIKLPFEIEEGFNPFSEITFEWYLIVVKFNGAKEESESISVIKLLVKCLVLVHKTHEDTHNIRENIDAEQQNDCAKDPFVITSGIEISEAYSRKCSERIIRNCDDLTPV